MPTEGMKEHKNEDKEPWFLSPLPPLSPSLPSVEPITNWSIQYCREMAETQKEAKYPADEEGVDQENALRR